MPMPTRDSLTLPVADVMQVIRKARQIMTMLQGTMGLEGMGLDAKAYRRLKRKAILELMHQMA